MSKIKPDLVQDSNKVIKIPEIELKKTGKIVELEGKKRITSSRDAYYILNDIWNKDLIEAVEQSFVLFLNNNNKPIGYYHHSSGGINATIMDKEIICAMAVKSLSKGVIISHNHPSGILRPSEPDIRIAKEIKEALKLFDIKLLDALIITYNDYYSSADNDDI